MRAAVHRPGDVNGVRGACPVGTWPMPIMANSPFFMSQLLNVVMIEGFTEFLKKNEEPVGSS